MFNRTQSSILGIGLIAAMLPFGALAQTTTEPETPPARTPVTVAAAPQFTDRATSTAAPTEDVTTGSLSAGGALNTGNTRSATLSAGGNFRMVRGRNTFELESTFNLGAADATPNDAVRSYDLNSRNWNTRARYDRFLTDNDALYLSARHRWDTFAGFDTRLQLQVGYLRNFYNTEKQRFWGEIGYDFTYDRLTGANADGDRNVYTHAGRAFLGYRNNLNEHVEWLVNAEVLVSPQDWADVRVNADTAIRASVARRLQLELMFKMQYDNVPVVVDGVAKEKLDTQTTVRLVYSLF